MNLEEKLKDLILSRYSSLREFTIAIDMSYSTFDSILRRGVQKSTAINIIKICKALNISADALGRGEIVHNSSNNVGSNRNDEPTDVLTILELAKNRLLSYEGLTFNGEPADAESVKSILDAMEIGVELAKRRNEGLNGEKNKPND